MFDNKKNLFGTQSTTPTFSPVISASTLAPSPTIKLPTAPVQPPPVQISAPTITPIQQNPVPQPQAGQVVNNRYTDPQGNLRDAKTGAILDKTTGQPTNAFQQTPTDTTPAPTTPPPTQTQDITTPTQEETDQKSLMDKILGFFGSQKTSEQIRQEAETKAGVAQQQQFTDELFNEIQQIEAQNRNDVLSLQGQGRGIDQTILSRQANEINRQYAIKLEPKRALYQAAAGRLDRANQAVERAVNAELESQKQRLDYFRLAYDMNKDSLERADKKRAEQAQARLKQEERDYEQLKFNRTESLKIANAAVVGAQSLGVRIPDDVMSRIQNASTPEEALAFASPYLGVKERLEAQTEALQQQKIRLDIAQSLKKNNESVQTFANPIVQSVAQTSIKTIDSLKTASGINKAVGATKLARFTPFKADVMTGDVSSFIGSVEQLVSSLSKDALAQAKASGATFGALSDSEWKILGDSATKINAWRIKDEDSNEVVGYKTSEKVFRQELDRIANLAKLDYLIKGGSPEDINVIETNDGKFWSKNSDGSLTELRRQ